jgi:hypothetical protein
LPDVVAYIEIILMANLLEVTDPLSSSKEPLPKNTTLPPEPSQAPQQRRIYLSKIVVDTAE